MFDWLKKLVTEKLVGLGIGYVVSHLAAGSIAASGVNVDPVKLQATLWTGYETFAHWIEGKTVGTKFEWVGKVL